jgi:hypothetical protein
MKYSKDIMYVLIAIAIMAMLFYVSRQETMVSKGKVTVITKAELKKKLEEKKKPIRNH